ncbi:hypothetical protein KR215_006424 [Drosophila sulfurigaster]|nr:hypothetical protein KR215_006424 [Drosophila sulfurigaster]
MCNIVILTVATLALISGQAFGQATTVPQNCSAVTESLDWNNTALVGNWLELARHPDNSLDACMEFSIDLLSNGTILTFNSTHSSSNSSLYQNVNEPNVNVTLVEGAKTGYEVKFNSTSTVFIKLLQLYNNNNYVIGCGYTNSSDNSTSYGFILGRASTYNTTGLQDANNNASASYANFQANNFTTILQTGCTRNSASQSLPLISGFLALALLLIKVH